MPPPDRVCPFSESCVYNVSTFIFATLVTESTDPL